MQLTQDQEKRIVEIAYFYVNEQIRDTVPNEKFYIFVESFCRTFNIDYTSISIVNTQFASKLAPDNIEKTLYAIVTGAKLKDLGLDYRTIRAHKKKVETGKHELYPRIMNRYLHDDMRKFIRGYLGLYLEDANYLHTFYKEGGFDYDFSRSGRDSQD